MFDQQQYIYKCTCPSQIFTKDWPDCGRCMVVECGFSRCLEPNEKYTEQGGICEYEHCISSMPSTDKNLSCPFWLKDCPGGKKKISNCKVAMRFLKGLAD